jgi:GAF domain-containing protein
MLLEAMGSLMEPVTHNLQHHICTSLQSLRDLLGVEKGVLFLLDQDTSSLNSWAVVCSDDLGRENLAALRVPMVEQRNSTVILPDVYAPVPATALFDKRRDAGLPPTRNLLSVPIRDSKGNVVGAVELINKASASFTAYDGDAVENWAGLVALLLENQKLQDEVQALTHELQAGAAERAQRLYDDEL